MKRDVSLRTSATCSHVVLLKTEHELLVIRVRARAMMIKRDIVGPPFGVCDE